MQEKTNLYMLFTASVTDKTGKVKHYVVKGETALDVLTYVQNTLKSPVLGVSITEYVDYLDSTENTNKSADNKE